MRVSKHIQLLQFYSAENFMEKNFLFYRIHVKFTSAKKTIYIYCSI